MSEQECEHSITCMIRCKIEPVFDLLITFFAQSIGLRLPLSWACISAEFWNYWHCSFRKV